MTLIPLILLNRYPPARSRQYNSLIDCGWSGLLWCSRAQGPPKRDCPADVTSLLIAAVCEFLRFMTSFLWFATGREFYTFTTLFLLSIAPICDLTNCWGHVGIEAAKLENPESSSSSPCPRGPTASRLQAKASNPSRELLDPDLVLHRIEVPTH